MKKMFLLCLLCVASGFCAVNSYAYPPLRIGTYQLSGGNSKWDGGGYQGEVTIYPQGENYRVVWRIGSSQSQAGVGILYNDILSVAYCDSSNTAWGVVSFRLVADGELQGRWTGFNGTSQKPEYLVWKGY
jgi:hypothetical protein